jgi:hypothetical protein
MRILTLLVLILFAGWQTAGAQTLKEYLSDTGRYDVSIPVPASVIHHEVGEWHITHDRLVQYMDALAQAAPNRIKKVLMGYTYEKRPQVLLIITSPKNHQRLELIREEHLKLSDPQTASQVNIENMPAVVWMGHSIHGNEASGANASLLTAYHLAAAQGADIENLLDNVVILFDPCFNPDGVQRFSTWVNQHKSLNLVSDPNSREFNEVWPGGRFNHYWFDLNRDWLPAVHVESRNRLEWFQRWKPNILTDHHEQGSNATFFFQPGVPSRVNPLTPNINQELTAKLATFHAKRLDKIGSLYFTRENYDDFYYGKGSTYPDIQGCIGILFEQASSRGHLQRTANGMLSFPATIKNQYQTALSTLEGAQALRKDLLTYQRDFYKNTTAAAANDQVKAYVFGRADERTKSDLFIRMLNRHQIKVYSLKRSVQAGGQEFSSYGSFVVPCSQPQYWLIKTIFEKTFNYKDSIFYDITSWTMPLAFGMDHAELRTGQYDASLLDKPVENFSKAGLMVGTESRDAYLMEWNELHAPAALNEILKSGLIAKVATAPFEMSTSGGATRFGRGTILIPVQMQTQTPDKIYTLLNNLTSKYGVTVYSVNTALVNSGIDLGSSRFAVLSQPQLAMFTGAGVNATDAGEVWHLLDQRMNMAVSQLEIPVFNRAEMSRYNTIIMTGGTYTDLNKEKLKTWVQNGGTLILLEEGINWAMQNGISTAMLKKSKAADSTQRLPYSEREALEGAQQVSGAIFGADVDLTHPLAYGYTQKTVSLFKANRVYLDKSKNPFATPFYYGTNPLQSGWVSKENLEQIKQSAAVMVTMQGSGRIIHIAENPNFRGFWLGGTRLMMNAIFFNRIIDPASAR